MFGLFKKNTDTSKLSKEQIAFLNQVDTEYMQVFNTKTVSRSMGPYLSRECMIKVSRKVFGCGERYFGAAKFRKTEWTLLSCIEQNSKIRKSVVFDKIKVGGDLAINVASNYTEEWVVNFTKPYVVVDIIEKDM